MSLDNKIQRTMMAQENLSTLFNNSIRDED